MSEDTKSVEVAIKDKTIDEIMRLSQAVCMHLTVISRIPYPRLIGEDGDLHDFTDIGREPYWDTDIPLTLYVTPDSDPTIQLQDGESNHSLKYMMRDTYHGYYRDLAKSTAWCVARAVLRTKEAIDESDPRVACLTDSERHDIEDACECAEGMSEYPLTFYANGPQYGSVYDSIARLLTKQDETSADTMRKWTHEYIFWLNMDLVYVSPKSGELLVRCIANDCIACGIGARMLTLCKDSNGKPAPYVFSWDGKKWNGAPFVSACDEKKLVTNALIALDGALRITIPNRREDAISSTPIGKPVLGPLGHLIDFDSDARDVVTMSWKEYKGHRHPDYDVPWLVQLAGYCSDSAVQYGKIGKPVIARYYANTADGLEKALLCLGWKDELDDCINEAYRNHVRHGGESYESVEQFEQFTERDTPPVKTAAPAAAPVAEETLYERQV